MISSSLRELRRQRLIQVLIARDFPLCKRGNEVPKGRGFIRDFAASHIATAAKSPLTPFIPERGLFQRGGQNSLTLAGDPR